MNHERRVEPIIALDVSSRGEVESLLSALGPACSFVKVGLQLFSHEGPDVVRWLGDRGLRVFLDLKLHDIPNTVAKAVAAVRNLGVELLTVHASGGADMLEAAQREAGSVHLLGVTVLTSLDGEALGASWGRSDEPVVEDEVVRLARTTRAAGLAGVVTAVSEARAIREALGPEPLIVTPGIRFADSSVDDQARIATPADATRAGASHLVIGRAVTAAPDPGLAMDRVLRELGGVTT